MFTLTSCMCAVMFAVFILPPLIFVLMYSARLIAWFVFDIPRDETTVEAFFLDDTGELIIGGLLLLLLIVVIAWACSCLIALISNCLYYMFVYPITWPYRRVKQHYEDKKDDERMRQFARIYISEARNELSGIREI